MFRTVTWFQQDVVGADNSVFTRGFNKSVLLTDSV